MNTYVDERGSALVEFAVFLALLTLFFVGVVDYALEIQQAMQVTEAATAGAEFGAIPGNQKNFSGMRAAATNAASGVNGFAVTAVNVFSCTAGGASVSSGATCSGYGTPIDYVRVNTSATVPPLLAYIGMPSSLALKGSASFRVPWTP
jgi:Flp pilus assembly protein TadG